MLNLEHLWNDNDKENRHTHRNPCRSATSSTINPTLTGLRWSPIHSATDRSSWRRGHLGGFMTRFYWAEPLQLNSDLGALFLRPNENFCAPGLTLSETYPKIQFVPHRQHSISVTETNQLIQYQKNNRCLAWNPWIKQKSPLLLQI